MDSVGFQDKFWVARKNFLEAIEEYKQVDNQFFEFAIPLEQLHVEKCQVVSTRENLLHYLPKNAVIAEVGTQTGYFARKIIDVTLPTKLHTIDIDWSIFDKEKFLPEIESGVMQIHKGDSVAILSEFPDEHFDWIYIDADHSYKGVYRDIRCASKKLKENGLLVFNDYTVWSPLEAYPYGVLKAVNEFCLTQGWEFIFLALATSGYHDVAIRKRKIGVESLDIQYPVEVEQVSTQAKAGSVGFQDKFWVARKNFLEAIEEYKQVDNQFFEFAIPLEQLHVEKCQVVSTRENLLHYLPKNAVIAEVGTQTGYFARKIIDVTLPTKLHTIDIDWSIFDKEKFLPEIESGVMQIHKGDSVAILSEFPDEHFDWIYIDADHSYKGVYRDIRCASKKLKENGLLVFNDYTVWSPLEAHPYGVLKAVNEFCLTQGWEFIFLALAANGYHDVAIRKRKIGVESLDIQYPVEVEKVSTQVEYDVVQLQFEKAKLAYQLQEIQQGIEIPEPLLQQIQQEIVIWEIQRQQTQHDLKQSQLQVQHLQTELSSLRSQLQKSQTEIEYSQSQLQKSQTEIEYSQSQLQKLQAEIEYSQSQLQKLQAELEHCQANIIAMQSSKFWKLRTQWFKFKKLVGIAKDAEINH